MLLPLTVAVLLLCSALLAWAVWFAIRDRAVILRQLWGASVVEVALLVQVAVAGVLAAQGRHAADGVTFWGYQLTALMVLPFAALWAFAERSRWSSVVLAVATATVMFLEYRMLQIWGAA